MSWFQGLVSQFFFWLYICGLGLGLWCLTPLSTIFQLYHGGGKQSTRRKVHPPEWDLNVHLCTKSKQNIHVQTYVKH